MPTITKKNNAIVEVSETRCVVDEITNSEFQIMELSNHITPFVQILYIMNKTNSNNSKDETNDSFKARVKEIMREDGASELYIQTYLTDAAVLNAIINNCSPEDLAWVLLH